MSLKELISFRIIWWTVKIVIAAFKLEEILRGIEKKIGKKSLF